MGIPPDMAARHITSPTCETIAQPARPAHERADRGQSGPDQGNGDDNDQGNGYERVAPTNGDSVGSRAHAHRLEHHNERTGDAGAMHGPKDAEHHDGQRVLGAGLHAEVHRGERATTPLPGPPTPEPAPGPGDPPPAPPAPQPPTPPTPLARRAEG